MTESPLKKYGADNVETFQRTPYFAMEGTHDVLIKKAKTVNNRKVSFIVEAEIVESTSEEHYPGQRVCQVMTMGSEYKYGEKDLKAFVCGIHGVDPSADDANEQLQQKTGGLGVTDFAVQLEELTASAEADVPARVQTWPHLSETRKAAGKPPVTRHKWEARS